MSLKAEVARDKLSPNDWRVEKIDSDGDVEVAIFSGPKVRDRAIRFADMEYRDWDMGR